MVMELVIKHHDKFNGLRVDNKDIADIGEKGGMGALADVLEYLPPLREYRFEDQYAFDILANRVSGTVKQRVEAVIENSILLDLGLSQQDIRDIICNGGPLELKSVRINYHTLVRRKLDLKTIVKIASYPGIYPTSLDLIAKEKWEGRLSIDELLMLACRENGNRSLKWFLKYEHALQQNGVPRKEILDAATKDVDAREEFLNRHGIEEY